MAEQAKIYTQRRYQAVVNRITKTKIYKDNLTELTKNLNVKWTPHNVKALIFDAFGFGYINFRTNTFVTNLMDAYEFNNILPADIVESEIKQGRNPFKSTRPMINTVIEPYIMSNVEEIVFHKGNFNDYLYDLQFEQEGIKAFINQKAKTHCVRLQWYIEIEQGFTYELYQGYNPQKQSIRSFLEEMKIPYIAYELNPERNEAGYLTKYVLNSGNYKYDAKYDPNDKNCKGEEYNLSKYFYEYDLAAKKALEEMKKPRDEKEEPKKVEDEVVYDAQVESAVKATLSKLETFYSPLWGKKYDAMFCETGLKYTVSGRNIYNRNKSIVDAMYSAWKETANVENVADVESAKFDMKSDFSPGFHHTVLNNRELWSKGSDSQPSIKKQIYNKYLEKYNDYYFTEPEKLDKLERMLTNCFVIKSWGKNDVILRFTGIKPAQKEEFERVFNAKLAATYRGGSLAGMISNCEINSMGIGTLTYIINWQEFLDEILFAHKQYTEHNVKPSLTQALLGLKMDGTPLTINLIETGQMLTTILAGSRSGKGTLTMGLLASLFGAGGSIVYLDNKPDIGSMLWDLEREYADKGLKLLSLDVGKEMHEFTGSLPLRTGELNLLPNDIHQSTAFRTLRLCKLFQLVTLLGKHSSEISKKLGITTDNLFFIIDELTSLNADYTTLELYVKEMSKKYKSIADKQKATEEDKALAKYYATLENMIIQMNTDLVQGLTKDWGMSGIRVILVGQELGAKWKVAGKGFNTSFAGLLMNSTHKTLAGRIQSNSNTYRFGKSGAKLAEQTGVFTYSNSAPSPIDAAGSSTLGLNITQQQKFQQFRSYFSLVKNDFNYDEFEAEGIEQYVVNHPKRFTTQLLDKYLSKGEDAISRVVNELYDVEDGRNRDEISFSGLIKVMQRTSGVSEENLIANMNKGYQILDGLFRLLGLKQYQHLEEYLCDCSPEGVFTLAELKGILGLAGGSTPQKKKTENIIDLEEEINFFGSAESVEKETKSQHQNQKAQFGQRPQPQPQQSARQPQQTYRATYTKQLDIPANKNPFENYSGNGAVSTLNQLKDMSKFILQDITSMVGSLDRVTSLRITEEGVLIINDTVYQPTFNKTFIDSLPFSLQGKVNSGCVVELLDLGKLYQFKNLQSLVIENNTLAQGRARRELKLKPHARYDTLFKKFAQLQYINVGGIEYRGYNPDEIVTDTGETLQGYGVKNRMKRLLPDLVAPKPAKTESRMNDFWESKQMKLLTNAFGWTVSTYGVYLAATLLGPIGLMFGAFAMAGAYKELKGSQPNHNQRNSSQGSRRGNGNNNAYGNYNQNNRGYNNRSNSNQRPNNQKRRKHNNNGGYYDDYYNN